MRERMVVADPRTARMFSNARARRMLLELAARESSLQQVADRLQLALNLAHYHVTRLLALRLVEVTREQPRAGRVIRHYRAVARSFFVPTQFGSPVPGQQLESELRASLDRMQAHDPKDGIVYFTDETLRPRMLRTQAPPGAGKSVAIEAWHQLMLTREDARLLAGELKDLFARYEGRTGARTRAYLAYCALAPRAGQRARIGR